jgi:type IV pilus assembly protein PilX
MEVAMPSLIENSHEAIRRTQQGVVLVIALIMLTVISLLAALSMRNSISTESVSGNVRTGELATQAAEVALRYCEESVIQQVAGSVTFVANPTILAYSATPTWSLTSNWDVSTSPAFVLPATALNQAGLSSTYSRLPECMVENMPMANTSGTLSTTSTYVITARGFGPEVTAVDAARNRPKGTEVWMQSTIELQ